MGDDTMQQVSGMRFALVGAILIAISFGLARFAFGLFVPQIRADLALSAIASAAGDVVSRPEVANALGITKLINYLPGRVTNFLKFRLPDSRFEEPFFN